MNTSQFIECCNGRDTRPEVDMDRVFSRIRMEPRSAPLAQADVFRDAECLQFAQFARQYVTLEGATVHDPISGLPNYLPFSMHVGPQSWSPSEDCRKERLVGGTMYVVSVKLELARVLDKLADLDCGALAAPHHLAFAAIRTCADTLLSVAGENEIVYHLGDDEFAVVLRSASQLDVESRARDYRAALSGLPCSVEGLDATRTIVSLEVTIATIDVARLYRKYFVYYLHNEMFMDVTADLLAQIQHERSAQPLTSITDFGTSARTGASSTNAVGNV